jgi:outer membrane protein assembly factor BamB
MADQLRALTCPNCGAPLDFSQGERKVECSFCGSVIERSDDAPTPDDEGHALKINFADGRVTVQRAGGQQFKARHYTIKMGGGRPVVIEDDDAPGAVITSAVISAPQARRAARAAGGVGALVGCIILVSILLPIVILLFAVPQITNVLRSLISGDVGGALTAVPTLGSRINVRDDVLLAPSLSDAPPDLIALADVYPADGGDYTARIVALSGAEPKLLWQSAPLDTDTYDALLVADRERVYTVTGARLLAINRADGATAWEAALADTVQISLCGNCLRLLGDHVAVLSDDGTLQVFDARTGQAAWEFEANQDSPRGLYVLDDQLAFLDNDEDNNGLIRLFAPATGDARTIQPECEASFGSPSRIYWYTPVYAAPDGSDFYLAYGAPEFCVQRWSAGAGEMVWQTIVPDVFGEPSAPPLVTDEALYLSSRDRVVAVNAETGEAQTLSADEDYEFAPLAVQDRALLVRALRTRGSQRFALWALDAASGDVEWKFDLGEDFPVGASSSIINDEQSAWAWRAAADGLLLLRFRRASDDVSHTLLVDALDWRTGESRGQQRVPLGIETIILSSPVIAGWTGDTVWFSIESSVLAFDAASQQIVYRWP